ncbi:hypothetical protein BDV98DRAFT_576566 [Pterulicium gracile]|uniref:GATA-type domain-containing protein n=1 Tax=Pterulicium gracile TaxID=1884261 RepID=A0A5C3Q301_9AGAR|nr:hypothetical protein BDV98DRAFT_576566 [Pterula gracilis]
MLFRIELPVPPAPQPRSTHPQPNVFPPAYISTYGGGSALSHPYFSYTIDQNTQQIHNTYSLNIPTHSVDLPPPLHVMPSYSRAHEQAFQHDFSPLTPIHSPYIPLACHSNTPSKPENSALAYKLLESYAPTSPSQPSPLSIPTSPSGTSCAPSFAPTPSLPTPPPSSTSSPQALPTSLPSHPASRSSPSVHTLPFRCEPSASTDRQSCTSRSATPLLPTPPLAPQTLPSIDVLLDELTSNEASTPRECSHCKIQNSPLWRRHPETYALLCNACGLYLQANHELRPRRLIDEEEAPPPTSDGKICSHCNTTTTSVWRRGGDGQMLCNACGVYYRLRGRARPLELRADRVKRRVQRSKKEK